jgi:Flp pilus assembly protein TadG
MKRRVLSPVLRGAKRRGVAAVEFAMCVPLFVLLTIGAIQTTDAIYLKNSLRVVAYETVRQAVEPAATNTTCDAKANEILTARNVQGGTVSYNPSDVSTAVSGQAVTVTVSASADTNTIMPNWFYTGKTISSQLTMSKE